MDDLKPCPFCGGEAIVISARYDGVVYIQCNSCAACWVEQRKSCLRYMEKHILRKRKKQSKHGTGGLTMARLIDADGLLMNVVTISNSKGQVAWSAVTTTDILTAPTVDAVEVVRCRDCKYYYDYGVNRDYCCRRSKDGRQVFDVKFKTDDFCSYGERRTDG